MTDARLYSIAAIAKILDQPESTLHYWKNRFHAFLPSVGEGRHKRFRAEAVDIFAAVGRLLKQGMTAADVKAELAALYPTNVSTEGRETASAHALAPSPSQEAAVLVGREIAKAVGGEIRAALAEGCASPSQAGVEELREELSAVKTQNKDLAGKLKVLEAELTRLRKDGREMEKYLLGKIKGE